MNSKEVIKRLQKMANPKNVEGMARFGISTNNTLGISIPFLRDMVKEIGRDHKLALELWDSGIHEARMLACFVDEVDKVTEKQMDEWVAGFDSWDICDQCCSNLFDRTPFVHKKILQWVKDEREFMRRAGFVLIAAAAVHRKEWQDEDFLKYFPLMKEYATDERNYVRKAVNWALRQVGKRNLSLNKKAIEVAKEIKNINSKSARWIAADALRELEGDKLVKRLGG
ncbi:MAG: DNA alkylation repair protein [Candidatus Woesearchaeota archaeon]